MRKEIIGLLLFFAIVVTSVSLFSYSPSDPSINTVGFSKTTTVQNAFGLVGSHIAGFLVGLFGLGSFWVPVLLVLGSIWYLQGRSSRILLLTFFGGLLLIVATAAGFAMPHDQYVFMGRQYPAGGLVGSPLTYFLLKYANKTGCIIILVLLFCLGLVLSTGLSMFALATLVRRGFMGYCDLCYRAFHKLLSLIKNGFSSWRKRREERLKEINIKAIETKPKKPALIEEKKSPVKPAVVKSAPDKETIPASDKADPLITTVKVEKEGISPTGTLSDIRETTGFMLPPVSLLNDAKRSKYTLDREALREKGMILEKKLNDFGISGEVVEILPGPVLTTFEYRPAPGIKISKIVNLTDDLALALSAISIRIVAPIPGKDVIGVELPNDTREDVSLKSLISSTVFIESKSKLTIGLGKDILGLPVAARLDTMPHLLIAGATGTGKSVCLNSLIISLLYKSTPDEVKFIMIDPKRIELSVYDGIPHLISPVVTDMKKATNALFWGVREMERRYELLAESGVRKQPQPRKNCLILLLSWMSLLIS